MIIRNADLAKHAATAWEAIQVEISGMEEWVSDPDAKVTRSAILKRLGDVSREVLRSLKDLVEDSNDVLEEVRDKCEEAVGSGFDRVGIRERLAVAMEILERDAGVSERELNAVARQFDPVRVLVRERKRRG